MLFQIEIHVFYTYVASGTEGLVEKTGEHQMNQMMAVNCVTP